MPRLPDVRDLAPVAALAASMVAYGGEGLCLPVTAAMAHVLHAHDVPDVHAVCGSYNGDAHWWTRVGDLVVDPTRGQFDDGPLVSPVGTAGYEVEHEYPPGWTAEHVVLEAVRAFEFVEAGAQFGRGLLDLLMEAAHLSCASPAALLGASRSVSSSAHASLSQPCIPPGLHGGSGGVRAGLPGGVLGEELRDPGRDVRLVGHTTIVRSR